MRTQRLQQLPILAAAICWQLGTTFCPTAIAANRLTTADLTNLCQTVSPFPYMSTNYPKESWAALIDAARKLQDCEPDSVQEALRSYQAASERVQSRGYFSHNP